MKTKFRNALASCLSLVLIALGITSAAKKKLGRGDYILSIYFHAPTKGLFEFCIKWLIRNGFRFLSQEDLYDIHKKAQHFPKKPVIITVDDGWQTNQENVVGIANKYRVPVTIFVATDAIEKGNFWWSTIERANQTGMETGSVEFLKTVPNREREKIVNEIEKTRPINREALTMEQLQTIAASEFVTIGSHTVSHPVLIHCADEQVRYELQTSKQKIEEWLNKPVTCFAYPNGNYSDRELAMLKETGYTAAYTTEPDFITRESLNNMFQLPRFYIFENISKAEAICRMTGTWQRLFKK